MVGTMRSGLSGNCASSTFKHSCERRVGKSGAQGADLGSGCRRVPAEEGGIQPVCSIQTSAVPPMEIRIWPNATVLE